MTTRKISGGFYIKARVIQESEIAHAAPHIREVWDWLIREANHKPQKTHGKIIERGQILTDYKEIMDGLHWKEGFIKKTYKKHDMANAMVWLRQRQMIITSRTTRGMIVTICNYDTYQSPGNYDNNTDNATVITGQLQPTSTINKNGKKEKNESIDAGADPFFEMFRRATGDHISDQELVLEIAKFRNKYPNKHPNQSGGLINAWIANIGKNLQEENPVTGRKPNSSFI